MGLFFDIGCPDCGRRFNWWQRAVGEYKKHRRRCSLARQNRGHIPFSTGCRGCPAGCYEKAGDDRMDGAASGKGEPSGI